MSEKHKFFYDAPIYKDREKDFINNLLKKYRNEPATDALKQKIWDELSLEKSKGNIKIPFKVVLRKDPTGIYPDAIEVILDTKV
jgi:hypothetical protein